MQRMLLFFFRSGLGLGNTVDGFEKKIKSFSLHKKEIIRCLFFYL